MTAAGFTYIFWVADWFAFLNLKQGGDLNKIQLLGHYFIDIWRAAGMDMSRVKFLWASKEILARPEEYMGLMLKISTKFNLARLRKCGQALGRGEEEEKLQASQILYSVMQCADIFFLDVGVCQLGMDQRKINVLARDFVDDSNSSQFTKPIILSHTMLPGLKQGQEKMSKSVESSSIYMDDSEEEVVAKLKKAFCEGPLFSVSLFLSFILLPCCSLFGLPYSPAPLLSPLLTPSLFYPPRG